MLREGARRRSLIRERAEGVKRVMHKRTTPKIFARAKELHRNMSPAEAELWKHLRAHRMGDVHFRNQHAVGNYIVDFSPEGDDVCSTKKANH